MTNLRAQSAAAAKEWELSESEVSGDCPRDDDGVLQASGVFVAGYLLGHAAGVEEGARRFAEWLMADGAEQYDSITVRRCVPIFLSEFASSLAPGTPTPEPHCGWAPGHYKNICCICGKAFSDCDKRAVTCLPCADKELAKSSLAPGTGEEPKGG